MSRVLLDVFVPGKPEPKGSPGIWRPFGGGRRAMLKERPALVAWEEFIRSHVRAGRPACAERGAPVSVHLDFILPRTAGAPRGGRWSLARRIRWSIESACKKPDVDKLARAVLDALGNPKASWGALCFEDDAQVVRLLASKRSALIDQTPGVRILVRRLHLTEAAA